MQVSSFSEIEEEFLERVHSMVWCSAATLDTRNRLRSRILHPLWEGNTARVGTRRHSLKAKHLAHNPYMSLAYIRLDRRKKVEALRAEIEQVMTIDQDQLFSIHLKNSR